MTEEEREFSELYEKLNGTPPTEDELADFMAQADEDFEECWNAFEEEHKRPPYSEEELGTWLELQIEIGAGSVH